MTIAISDSRPQPRRKIFQLGELTVGGRTLRVHLLDVSEGGARLHCPAEVNVGDPVILRWQDNQWRGIIMWTSQGKCGVRFIAPLTAAALSALLAPV